MCRKRIAWDFHGGPVVRTLPSNAGSGGSTSGQGTKILHASGLRNRNIKQKWYCNTFKKDFKNGPYQKILKEKGILVHFDGNVSWWSHYWKQYGNSSKN